MSNSSGSKITPEELRALRSAAGKKGGNAPHVRRGRKINPNKIPSVQIRANKIDVEVFNGYSKMNHVSVKTLLHFVASYLLKKYSAIQKPDGWIE